MAKKIDGMMLKEMFSSGAALLTQNRESVDALNVFPVPDGDTGTNMTQTITSAIREMNSKRYTSVSDVADAVARGALKGARGNSGVILSQILRGFARALAGRPEILVLDNADSALDYQTAARLWAALRRDFPRTTLVIISERVASVRDADCILVLEHGRILASGRHQDLLVSAPRYRKMAELQMGGETV